VESWGIALSWIRMQTGIGDVVRMVALASRQALYQRLYACEADWLVGLLQTKSLPMDVAELGVEEVVGPPHLA
jgi:hypothetical protein